MLERDTALAVVNVVEHDFVAIDEAVLIQGATRRGNVSNFGKFITNQSVGFGKRGLDTGFNALGKFCHGAPRCKFTCSSDRNSRSQGVMRALMDWKWANWSGVMRDWRRDSSIGVCLRISEMS